MWVPGLAVLLQCYPLGSIWQPGIYIYISIHFVWGDMFYMPVLPVIGQTFTLGLYEALGKQQSASILAGRLQEMLGSGDRAKVMMFWPS